MERREHNRTAVPTVTLRVKDEEKFRSRYLRDLSMGGVFVQTKQVLPESSELQIKLFAPHAEDGVVLDGRVVRIDHQEDGSTPRGMAIQFTETEGHQRQALESLLANYGIEETSGDADETSTEAPQQPPAASSSGSAATAALEAEISALRARLSEADHRIMGLHEEIEAWESDDAEQRELVESLLAANNDLKGRQAALANTLQGLVSDNEQLKKLLESVSDEGEAARQEFWKLNADVAQMLAAEQQKSHRAQENLRELNDELNRQLNAAKAELESLRGTGDAQSALEEQIESLRSELDQQRQTLAQERTDFEVKLAETEAALAALRADAGQRPQVDASQLDRLQARFDRARRSERHLRKMLKMLSADATQPDAVVSDDELRALQDRSGMQFEFTPEDELDDSAFRSDEAALPGLDAATLEVPEEPTAETSTTQHAPPPPAPQDEGAAASGAADDDDEIDIDAENVDFDDDDDDDIDFDVEVDDSAAPPPPQMLAQPDFKAQLDGGALVAPTEALATAKIDDRNEAKLAEFLVEPLSLEAIKKKIPWRLRKRVIDDLYAFYRREYLTLTPRG